MTKKKVTLDATPEPTSLENIFGEVIYSYTRAQALEDGVLIDVSDPLAKEAGIKFPIAVTSGLWDKYIQIPESLKGLGQDEKGRLWDILWMFRENARKSEGSDLMFFEVIFVMPNYPEGRICKLKSVIGPGDEGEPVITIMLPDED